MKHLVCASLVLAVALLPGVAEASTDPWLITEDPARSANAHDFFGDHYSKKM